VLRFLLAVFALTVIVWSLAAFVPAFQGWHHLANLGGQFLIYLTGVALLLQGFRRFWQRHRPAHPHSRQDRNWP
jgi:hypothetical protein